MVTRTQMAALTTLMALLTPSLANSQNWIQLRKTGDASFSGDVLETKDVTVVADTAFVLHDSSGTGHLVSLDVTACQATQVLSDLRLDTGHVRALAIDGDDAFIAWGEAGLLAVDIESAESLIPRDTLGYSGANAADVSVGGESGYYAYIADDSLGLVIANISNPGSLSLDTIMPLMVGGLSTHSTAVYADSDFVHVVGYREDTAHWATYHIVDVRDADSPKVVGTWISFPWCEQPWDIVVENGHAYIAVDDNEIFVFSTIASVDSLGDTLCYPCFLDSAITSEAAKGLDLTGDYLYCGSQTAIDVYYLGDPSSPVRVGVFTPATGQPGHLDVSGQRVFVAAWAEGLQILCQEFSRGDMDDTLYLGDIGDGDVNYLLNYVFYSGPTPLPAEWNGDVRDVSTACDKDDPTVDAADVICLNNFVNNGGAPPDCVVEQCPTCGP